MYFQIISPARAHQTLYSKAEEDYFKRIQQYARLDVIDLKANKAKKKPVAQRVSDEGQLILDKLPSGSTLVALDESEQLLTSEKLANFIENQFINSKPLIVFALGGPYGLSAEVKQRADLKLSLSPLTFTSQLARFILAEQIYRAISIIKGLPYHNQTIE